MTKKAVKLIPLGICVLVMCALSACKGRTMSNMEPTGDTVEVVIPVVPDTV
ncbi:MAG: hypothetical protein K2K97_10165 [Muribaculaceae bacterium]|nr:hypothetical protein [Muribaculaceae bacterium]